MLRWSHTQEYVIISALFQGFVLEWGDNLAILEGKNMIAQSNLRLSSKHNNYRAESKVMGHISKINMVLQSMKGYEPALSSSYEHLLWQINWPSTLEAI